MYWEIIPAFTIVTAAVAAGVLHSWPLNYLVLGGNGYRRAMNTGFQRLSYLRDRRITGHPYVLCGLECIPDAEEEEVKKEEVVVVKKDEEVAVVQEEEKKEPEKKKCKPKKRRRKVVKE